MKNYIKKFFHFIFNLIFARVFMPKIHHGEIKKILLSGYTGLGHFILKSVLVQKLQDLYTESKIFIIAGNSFGTEFVLDDYSTFILKQESSWLKKIFFFLQLRKEKIDLILLPIDASPKFLIRGSILAGIPIRVSHVFENEPGGPDYYYTEKVPVKPGKIRSELDMNYDLLDAICPSKIKRSYQPFVSMNFNGLVLNNYKLERNKYISIQMGSANGLPTTKKWLEENFRELIKKLLHSFSEFKIVAVGDTGDSKIINRILKGIKSENLINLSGKTTLNELKSLLFNSKFVICHDSGVMHMSNALKKDIIAIYGPSDPDFYAINLSTFHLIRKEIHCSPCQGLFPGKFSNLTEEESLRKCPVPECMKSVSVDDVYNKCVELFN